MSALIIICAVGAVLGGVMAKNKGRSVGGWAVLGAILPLSLLILLALRPLAMVPSPYELASRGGPAAPKGYWACKCGARNPPHRLLCESCNASRPGYGAAFCPYCLEEVKEGAIRCKHCHADFDEPIEAVDTSRPVKDRYEPPVP